MKKTVFLFLFLFIYAIQTNACLNYYCSEAFDLKIKEMTSGIGKYKNVRPEKDNQSESCEIKIHGINYKEILIDNTHDNKITWNEINTNTSELLAMADLSKSVEEVQQTATKDTSELQMTEEDAVITSPKPITKEWENEPEEKNNLLFYIAGAVLVILTFLFYKLRRKK